LVVLHTRRLRRPRQGLQTARLFLRLRDRQRLYVPASLLLLLLGVLLFMLNFKLLQCQGLL
jgi:hypothetical protein